MKKLSSMATMAFAALALAGCGGGGSSSLGFGSGSSSGSGSSGGTGGTGGTTTYSMGNGSGSSFQSGQIGISSTSLSGGGTTNLEVSIVDQTGTLYTGAAVTVTFNSTCISQGLASVTASGSSTPGTSPNTVSTSTGTAEAAYTAKGCSGPDVITASATVGSTSLTATGTVTVADAATGSIQFKSAIPSTIGLKGTGQPSTSTVVFEVLDATGAPKPGVSVNFSLDSTVGGLSLTPSSATSAADGTVQTVVSSGTVHTAVKVTAAVASPALSTQSSVLTVTTGIPASNAFSIAVGSAQYGAGGLGSPPACPNIEAYGTDGVVVPVTVRLSDRYSNPVLDGTAVTFHANGGQIVGSCTTTGGACVANWTSAQPRPQTTDDSPPLKAAGRVTILATAIGEEYFTDTNRDGFWESGEPFQDLGEPYEDDNENGTFDAPEYYLDYNHNGKWDGPSGSFVGITCTGTDPSSTCTGNTLAIGASHLLIMSTGGAQITKDPTTGNPEATFTGFTYDSGTGRWDIPLKGTGSIAVTIEDLNGNPIPAGSTVTVLADSGVGTVSSTTSTFTEGCSTNAGGDTFTTYITGASSAGSGNITFEVTSAGTKTLTMFTFPAEAQ
jgi:hypothetical protein